MRILAFVMAAALVAAAAPCFATEANGLEPVAVAELVRAAVGNEPAAATSAVASLRDMGPAGLEALLSANAERLTKGRPEPGVVDSEWTRLAAALDGVSAQRDSYASRLYWYTDLERAKAAATVSGRPILSLHMLGRLDEEFSCANSRFFRMALYANQEVSGYLREHFVLHWESERPVPRVTIDFGDGRKLERTLTGNSVHYVLDAQGRPVDALPGLYDPEAFRRILSGAEAVARGCAQLSDAYQRARVRNFHAKQKEALEAEWRASLARLRLESKSRVSARKPRARANDSKEPPTVAAAEKVTQTKAAVEFPLLRAIDLDSDARSRPYDDPVWSMLASARASEARLDPFSVALIRYHVPSDIYLSGPIDKEALAYSVERAKSSFESLMAMDSVRNEFDLHARIHDWFLVHGNTDGLPGLNWWIYGSLFLTPSSDPWLGLFPADVYTGLEGGGLSRR
jgi:hypothetical protein